MSYHRNLPTPSLFQRLQSYLTKDLQSIRYRLLNLISKWWHLEMDVSVNDDVQSIRHIAPFRGIILDADEPVEMSPGVYLMWGHRIDERRMRRYTCSVLGNRVLIECH